MTSPELPYTVLSAMSADEYHAYAEAMAVYNTARDAALEAHIVTLTDAMRAKMLDLVGGSLSYPLSASVESHIETGARAVVHQLSRAGVI